MSDERKAQAERWIRNYAAGLDIDYDELITEAERQVHHGDGSLRGGSELEGVSVSREFWRWYKVLKEERFMPDDPGDFFGCSC